MWNMELGINLLFDIAAYGYYALLLNKDLHS